MDFLEKDLEEIIYNSDRELLEEKGLIVTGKLFRQLRIGNYGIADLVTFERTSHPANKIVSPYLSITIYELKKDKIGISAFLQAIGYMKGIQRYLKCRNFKFDFQFSIVLIGKNIDDNSTFLYLSELIPVNFIDATQFLNCYTYDYNINGISFNPKYGYSLINEGL